VAPGPLVGKVEEAWELILGIREWATHAWIAKVAENLRDVAVPMLDREAMVTSEWPSAIRPAALCLRGSLSRRPDGHAKSSRVRRARALGEITKRGAAESLYPRGPDLPSFTWSAWSVADVASSG
jgi:hypothetical protein